MGNFPLLKIYYGTEDSVNKLLENVLDNFEESEWVYEINYDGSFPPKSFHSIEFIRCLANQMRVILFSRDYDMLESEDPAFDCVSLCVGSIVVADDFVKFGGEKSKLKTLGLKLHSMFRRKRNDFVTTCISKMLDNQNK